MRDNRRGRGPRRDKRQPRNEPRQYQPWAQRQMNERDFYKEKQEDKLTRYICPHCREEGEYPIRWMRREKIAQLPNKASEEDKARFAKARSYMVRVDEQLACRNIRCRKRFDVPTHQTVILL